MDYHDQIDRFLYSEILESDKKPVPSLNNHTLPENLALEEVIVYARKALRFNITLELPERMDGGEYNLVRTGILKAKKLSEREIKLKGFSSKSAYIQQKTKDLKKHANLLKHAVIFQKEIVNKEYSGEMPHLHLSVMRT